MAKKRNAKGKFVKTGGKKKASVKKAKKKSSRKISDGSEARPYQQKVQRKGFTHDATVTVSVGGKKTRIKVDAPPFKKN